MYSRRSFLHFLGRSALVGGTALSSISMLSSCKTNKVVTSSNLATNTAPTNFTLSPLSPSSADDLVLADGLSYDTLISWNDFISDANVFGFNNDYIAFVPLNDNDPTDGLLWVNHEYMDPKFVSGFDGTTEKTKQQVKQEQYAVGGSIVRIKLVEGKWQVQKNDPYNKRITGMTRIPIAWDAGINSKKTAIGTLANCSGGITPWGTILTCEENYDLFYGETTYEVGAKSGTHIESYYGWEKHFPYPPEHYGWVVEVNPKTGDAKKLVALGRCAHECATVFETSDKKLVVYTGDDANDQCLYKFISDEAGSLEKGTLYVANTTEGKWISLNIDEQPKLAENFKDQTDVLIRLREAAALVGGTPLDRPEDIEIDPLTGNVLISLTNNKPKGNHYGSILKIVEDSADKTGLSFESDTFLAGGEETGFACPDNMAFDPKGNLWFTSDISGSSINKAPYTAFQNNGLFLVPSSGERAGEVIQIASAPTDAELTGPFFSADGKTLFLSVQHPGELSTSMSELTSHWPEGGAAIPKPSVVVIQGPLLDTISAV